MLIRIAIMIGINLVAWAIVGRMGLDNLQQSALNWLILALSLLVIKEYLTRSNVRLYTAIIVAIVIYPVSLFLSPVLLWWAWPGLKEAIGGQQPAKPEYSVQTPIAMPDLPEQESTKRSVTHAGMCLKCGEDTLYMVDDTHELLCISCDATVIDAS